MDENKRILELIAELAKAASEWDGGSNQGVVYTSAMWREKLLRIAKEASGLAANIGQQHGG